MTTNTETITIRTEDGKSLDVAVLSKQPGSIQVVLGQGANSVKCELVPTRTGQVYVGNVMGREIVYERSRQQVQDDINKLSRPRTSRPRRP